MCQLYMHFSLQKFKLPWFISQFGITNFCEAHVSFKPKTWSLYMIICKSNKLNNSIQIYYFLSRRGIIGLTLFNELLFVRCQLISLKFHKYILVDKQICVIYNLNTMK
jgi:hypothetical protein